MSIILLLLFILFPIVFGLFLYRHSKKIALMIMSIPFLIILTIGSWFIYETNYHFVSSIYLNDEGLGEISLFDTVDENFKDKHGPYTTSENVFYKESLYFSRFHVGTNKGNKIIYLRAIDDNMSTRKGIHIGVPIQKVKDVYGENFYSIVEQGMDVIGYIDRENQVHIQFWHYQGYVIEIRMFYRGR